MFEQARKLTLEILIRGHAGEHRVWLGGNDAVMRRIVGLVMIEHALHTGDMSGFPRKLQTPAPIGGTQQQETLQDVVLDEKRWCFVIWSR